MGPEAIPFHHCSMDLDEGCSERVNNKADIVFVSAGANGSDSTIRENG